MNSHLSYIAVLMAKSPIVDNDFLEKAMQATKGAHLRHLSMGKAAEFTLGTAPEIADQSLRALIGESTIDLAIIPSENRKKRLLIADMDSTMIDQECIDELAGEVGVKDHVSGITARAMNGEIAFDDALRERVALLKGLPEGVIDQVVSNRITLAEGGKTLLATMRANGAFAALVSGGFTAFTQRIADILGFDDNRANSLLIENGALTGKVGEPILGAEAKVEALHDYCKQIGCETIDSIAVGDGANDLGMIGIAGMGVALHAKPSVAAAAPIRLNHTDLTSLLYLQGYQESAFHKE